MKNPRGPGASAISPVGRVRVPKDLGAVAHSLAGEARASGFVQDYWQAELIPGVWLQGQGFQVPFQMR